FSGSCSNILSAGAGCRQRLDMLSAWTACAHSEGNAMPVVRRRFLRLAGAAIGSLAIPSIGSAQAYPARPVRVIVPFAPAGPTDVFARLMAQKLSDQLGKHFYVENLSGAGGNIGTARAAQSPPDGYTMLVTGMNHVVNPVLYNQVPYDPGKD